MNVLFICRGNVGRSQMAEAIFADVTKNHHRVMSAGTEVGERQGEKIGTYESALAVLSVLDEIGIDVREKERTQLTEAMLAEADVVVSMAEEDTLPAYVQQYPKIQYWEVADPFLQSLEFTRQTREQITKLVNELAQNLE